MTAGFDPLCRAFVSRTHPFLQSVCVVGCFYSIISPEVCVGIFHYYRNEPPSIGTNGDFLLSFFLILAISAREIWKMKSEEKIASSQSAFEVVACLFDDGGEAFMKFVSFLVLIWLWIDTGSFFGALLLTIFIGPITGLVIGLAIFFLAAFFSFFGWIFKLFVGSHPD
ncbi:MAG: hypothetical protein LBS49_01520 [Candidatus Accumulibacter sp.]|jgi:hypothetical protein|nr:hypothetical protein [Accumulibacter sp.]